eukprot:SM000309S11869  [mRNA]  locus=s309:40999:48383:+ [translate_table: standard]
MASDVELRAVEELPRCYQPLFTFRYFNAVQSESFGSVLQSDQNIIVSSPTGRQGVEVCLIKIIGKTVLFELAIFRLLRGHVTCDEEFLRCSGRLKAVYIAPLKALVQERQQDWSSRFGKVLGLRCQELTGDSDQTTLAELQDADIICTTPEKFDAISRKHRDRGGLGFFADIGLLLIDEVHLLSESRGATLEAVVSRIKMLARFPEMRQTQIAAVRFMAVSATIPNIGDIGEWLQVDHSGLCKFGEETRPVQLVTRVLGYSAARNDFFFEKICLSCCALDIITQHSAGKPSLVFCSTRKGAQDAALYLAEEVLRPGSQVSFIKSQYHHESLQAAALGTSDKQMQICIRCGVGFHNGGMDHRDRHLVEGLFRNADLQVLCTTNTLAHGVNLPAHLVVIKSTQYYNKEKGGYVEYGRSMLLQMAGRAGRPQFDDSGCVVIMTRKDTVHLYEHLLSGSEPVESELLGCITEHLNAEIVLLTISDASLAIDWLKSSYLYVRVKKNPQHYKIKSNLPAEQLEKYICLDNIKELGKYGLLAIDDYGYTMQPLGIRLRRTEKKVLNDVNNEAGSRIKYRVLAPNGKLKKRIQTAKDKIFVLINDVLSGEPSNLDFTMTQDVGSICTNGVRILHCMADYYLFKKLYKESISSLVLAKSLKQRLWDDSPYQLKQLSGVGMATAKALLQAGISTFSKLRTSDPRKLESATGRKYPFGDQLKDSLHMLPPEVRLELSNENHSGRCNYVVILTRTVPVITQGKRHMANLVRTYLDAFACHLMSLSGDLISSSDLENFMHRTTQIIGNERSNTVLFHERISPYTIKIPGAQRHSTSDNTTAALILEDYGKYCMNPTCSQLFMDFKPNVNRNTLTWPHSSSLAERSNAGASSRGLLTRVALSDKSDEQGRLPVKAISMSKQESKPGQAHSSTVTTETAAVNDITAAARNRGEEIAEVDDYWPSIFKSSPPVTATDSWRLLSGKRKKLHPWTARSVFLNRHSKTPAIGDRQPVR